MARIAGIDLPTHKRIDIALTAIYGIGRKSAQDIVAKQVLIATQKRRILTNKLLAYFAQLLTKNTWLRVTFVEESLS